jgi:hypothetical protein
MRGIVFAPLWLSLWITEFAYPNSLENQQNHLGVDPAWRQRGKKLSHSSIPEKRGTAQ